MGGIILAFMTDGLAALVVKLVGLSAESLSKVRCDAPMSPRDDPAYKKNLPRLVEYHRQFEKKA